MSNSKKTAILQILSLQANNQPTQPEINPQVIQDATSMQTGFNQAMQDASTPVNQDVTQEIAIANTDASANSTTLNEQEQALIQQVFSTIKPLRKKTNLLQTIAELEDLMCEFGSLRNFIEEHRIHNLDPRILKVYNEVNTHILKIRWKIEEIHEPSTQVGAQTHFQLQAPAQGPSKITLEERKIRNAEKKRLRKESREQAKIRPNKAPGVIQFIDKPISKADLTRVLKEITNIFKSQSSDVETHFSTQQGATAHKRYYMDLDGIEYRLTSQSHGSFKSVFTIALLVKSLKQSNVYKIGILTDEIINQALQVLR